MSLARFVTVAAVAAVLWCLPATASAVGLFQCVDPAGNQVCVLDTGSMTDFSPSQLCNHSCPPCAGRCDGARYYPSREGHWEKQWQVAPGMSGSNILVPGADPRQDAQTIVREGLAAPAAPQTLPPAAPQTLPPAAPQTLPPAAPQTLPPGSYYPVPAPAPNQPLPPGYYYYVPPSSGTPTN